MLYLCLEGSFTFYFAKKKKKKRNFIFYLILRVIIKEDLLHSNGSRILLEGN